MIKGKIPSDFKTGTLSIYTNQKTLATVKINGEKTFSATIAKQTAGTLIYTRVVDNAGNKSVPVLVKVEDKTAPMKPTVNSVGTIDKSNWQSGSRLYSYCQNGQHCAWKSKVQ